MAKQADPQVRPETISKLSFGLYPSVAMLAGMQLDLFTPLKDGPLSGAELAEALGVRRDKLLPLLYVLVRADLLTVQGDRFANTAEANAYLVRGRPGYMGGAHELFADIWSAVLKTAESIRTGVPQVKHDFNAMSDEDLRAMFRGLHAGALAAGRELARLHDFARFRRLLDVGGGSGGLAIGACQTCPALSATVADLPRVAPIAKDFIAEAGLSDRVQVVVADLVAQVPGTGFDAAVVRSLIQVLSPEEARNVLRHVGRALQPGGAIFIVGRVLDDSRLRPMESVAFNLVFLNVYEAGQSYTESEYRGWLSEAGFSDIEIRQEVLPGGVGVITARKAG